MHSEIEGTERKILMCFYLTQESNLSFGDLKFLLLKNPYARGDMPSRYPTKAKKKEYKEWERKFSDPLRQQWKEPFKTCDFTASALAQILEKTCKKGYLQKIGRGGYAISEEYSKEPLRIMDTEILSSYPLKGISTFNGIPEKDRFPAPVHIYGLSENLVEFLGSKEYSEFEKMVKDFHLAALQLREFKRKTSLKYIESEFFKKCRSSKKYKKALRYAKEHPYAFSFILKEMVDSMEFYNEDELNYVNIIRLSKIEEHSKENEEKDEELSREYERKIKELKKEIGENSKDYKRKVKELKKEFEKKIDDIPGLDFEIDMDAIQELPEIAAIEVLKEIIKNNAEDLYPSIPAIVYNPLSTVRARLKNIVDKKDFMDKINYAIEMREEAIKAKSK